MAERQKSAKSYVLESKYLSLSSLAGMKKKGELKSATYSRDSIENKGRNVSRSLLTRDVDENKPLTPCLPVKLMIKSELAN